MDSFDVICVLVSILSVLFSLKCVADMRRFTKLNDEILRCRQYIDFCLGYSNEDKVRHYTSEDDDFE